MSAKKYGLIGHPLSHSWSKQFFTQKFKTENIDASYRLFDIERLHRKEQFLSLIHQESLDGLNVTLPYKEKVMDWLDEIDEKAKKVGAVNCIVIRETKTKGYNTDIIGFSQSLLDFIPHDYHSMKALVFGSGGAAKAVIFVLQQLHIAYTQVSRNEVFGELSYADLREEHFKQHQLLINTTPVGMFPHIDELLPLPYHYVKPYHYAFDLVYNPEKTSFLKACEAHGAHGQNGYPMLILQAEAAYSLFTNPESPANPG